MPRYFGFRTYEQPNYFVFGKNSYASFNAAAPWFSYSSGKNIPAAPNPVVINLNFFEIPLLGAPISFQITLGGVAYIMTVKWNSAPDAGWEFDLTDAATNNPIFAGQPLVTGTDLLAGLEYLGIAGSFYVITDGNPTAVPTFTNIGIDSNLYFATAASTA